MSPSRLQRTSHVKHSIQCDLIQDCKYHFVMEHKSSYVVHLGFVNLDIVMQAVSVWRNFFCVRSQFNPFVCKFAVQKLVQKLFGHSKYYILHAYILSALEHAGTMQCTPDTHNSPMLCRIYNVWSRNTTILQYTSTNETNPYGKYRLWWERISSPRNSNIRNSLHGIR